jgi:protein TonB
LFLLQTLIGIFRFHFTTELLVKTKIMKPELILQADILDIIFENRNKNYGAYYLRKSYNLTMIKAIAGMLLLVSVFCILNLFDFRSAQSESLIIPGSLVDLKPVNLRPELPKPVTKEVAKSAMTKFIKPLIVVDEVAEPVPEIKEIAKRALIGVVTNEGPSSEILHTPIETNIKDSAIAGAMTEEKSEILDRAEFMPEFPGGQPAFNRFLSKNLRVPEDALASGQQVRIVVRFIVGTQGELSGIQFLQTNGEVFEQEVIRVMKKMPTWKPGIQNGKPVPVYLKLPIIFQSRSE